jgi:mono/diheme cytochrome c family protein
MFRGTRVELLSVAVLPIGLGLAVQGAPERQVDPNPTAAVVAGPVSFAGQVAPLFADQCTGCHGTETQEAGLQLHTYEAVMKGSEYGTVVEAGDPDGSLLLEMISAGEMPQEAGALSSDQVAMVRSWIEDGAQNN